MSLLGMNAFQGLFLGGVLLVLSLTVAAVKRGRLTRREALLVTAIAVAAGIAVAWPQATGVVASWLGIGRGADLLFYCVGAGVVVGFWVTYLKVRALRAEITLLVRHIALLEGEKGEGGE